MHFLKGFHDLTALFEIKFSLKLSKIFIKDLFITFILTHLLCINLKYVSFFALHLITFKNANKTVFSVVIFLLFFHCVAITEKKVLRYCHKNTPKLYTLILICKIMVFHSVSQ